MRNMKIVITIPFSKVNLQACSIEQLYNWLDVLIEIDEPESYMKAAIVQNELQTRQPNQHT